MYILDVKIATNFCRSHNVHGATLIQATSATALEVQNAGGTTTLFNVDTSGNNVAIGATGASTGASTVHIADQTNGSGNQTVSIGSTNGSSTVLIQGGSPGGAALSLVTGLGSIQIGTNATAHEIDINNTTGASKTVISSGTGGILLSPNGSSNTGVTLKPATDSTAAFQIQDSSGDKLFTADTYHEQLFVGTPSALGTGQLNINAGGSGGEGITLTTPSGNTPFIDWNNGTSAFGIRSDDNSLLIGPWNSSGTTHYASLSVDTNGDTILQNVTDSGNAFTVQDAEDREVFNVDTSAGQANFWGGSTVATFDYQDGSDASGVANISFQNDRTEVGYDGSIASAYLRAGTDKGIQLQVQDGSIAALTIGTDGAATFQAGSDSSAAFQIQNAGGNPILSVDTTGSYIGGSGDGTVNIAQGSDISFGNYSYIGEASNGDLQLGNVSSVHNTYLTSRYFAILDPSQSNAQVLTIDNGGQALFHNATNSTSAFTIQAAGTSGTDLLTADTSNMKLNVNGTLNTQGLPAPGGTTPTVVGSSATAANTTNPKTIATSSNTHTGDLVMIYAYLEPDNEANRGATYGDITTPAGVVAAPGFPINTDDATMTSTRTHRMYAWYYYATANGSQNLTFTESDSGVYWNLDSVSIRGGATSGNPFADPVSTNTSSQGASGITSTPPVSLNLGSTNSLALWLYSDWDGADSDSGNVPSGYSTVTHATNYTGDTLVAQHNYSAAGGTGTISSPRTGAHNGMSAALMSFRAGSASTLLSVENSGGTTVGLIDSAGNVTLQGANSPTALQVNDSSGTTVLGVDTADHIVNVGGDLIVNSNSDVALHQILIQDNAYGAQWRIGDTTGGDTPDGLQGGYSEETELYSYWSLVLGGNRQSTAAPDLFDDGTHDADIVAIGSGNSDNILQVENTSGDSAVDLLYDGGRDAGVVKLGGGVSGGYLEFANNNTFKWSIGMDSDNACGGGTPSDTLYFYTAAGGCALQFSYGGDATFYGSNNANALQVLNGSGNSLFNINSNSNAITLFSGVTGGTLTTDIAGTKTSNAVCHSGGAGANANVQIVACTGSIVADYAESYPVASGITYGDIVATGTNMVNTYGTDADGNADWNNVIGQVTQMVKTTAPYQTNTIGVVSDNYNNFSSTGYNIKDEDNPMPVALNGRVLVNIAPDSGAIEPGDYVTTSATYSGKAMKATEGGYTIGKALAAWDPASGQTQVMVFVEPGYWPGPTNTQYLQDGDSATFSDLNVSGTATINNLSVTTLNASTATIGTLSVTGSAQFAGDITVGGHIITSGGQPTAQAQVAAGGSAAVSVDGTDTTGTITITTGSDPSSGDLAKILFSKSYTQAPHVVISASNDKAAGLRFYKGNTGSTDFMFDALDNPAPNTTYQFDYFISQ